MGPCPALLGHPQGTAVQPTPQPAAPETAKQKPTAFMIEPLKPQTVTVDILLVTRASTSPCRRSTQGCDYQDTGTVGAISEAAHKRPSVGRKCTRAKQYDHGMSSSLSPSPGLPSLLRGDSAGRKRSCSSGLANRPQPGTFASTNQRVWLPLFPQFAELVAPARARTTLSPCRKSLLMSEVQTTDGSTRDGEREKERDRQRPYLRLSPTSSLACNRLF